MTHSGRKGHLGNLLAILGLVIGILTLISVLTVMNGFQQGFIQSINEVYSYHLRLENPDLSLEEFLVKTGDIHNIKAVVPFSDYQAILTSETGYSSGIQIRFIDESAALNDDGFMKQMSMVRGKFTFPRGDSIILGTDLARNVNALEGDIITLSFMHVEKGKAFLRYRDFKVAGIFSTGYYEYDRNMAFGSLRVGDNDFSGASPVFGIKLNHHFRDGSTLNAIRKAVSLEHDDIVSWRVYNSAFFNALKIEKIFMLLIVGLIFIVVAVNIYHSMKRSVRERLEELALLKAMGGTPLGIKKIFLLQGLIIAMSGCVIGTLAGLLISLNINEIMEFFFSVIQSIRMFLFQYAHIVGADSSSPFYFTNIPVQVMAQDLIIINGAALLSVLIASFASIRSYAAVNPAEVFRSE